MSNKPQHPVQPFVRDEYGTIRFLSNPIVEFLLDAYGPGLNKLATKGFDQEDWQQFAQLIGYSLDGFGTLSYVSDETWSRVNEQPRPE